MEETALQYCQRLIELITLGDKDISIKSRLIHLKNKIEEESRPVQVVAGGLTATKDEIKKLAEKFFYDFAIQFDENALGAPIHIIEKRIYASFEEVKQLYIKASQREA